MTAIAMLSVILLPLWRLDMPDAAANGDQFYAWLRLALNTANVLCWGWTLWAAVPLAKRAQTPDQRLFVLAVVWVLFVVSTLLALSAFYNPFRPPNPDGLLAALGIAIPTSLVIPGLVILWKWPWRPKGKRWPTR